MIPRRLRRSKYKQRTHYVIETDRPLTAEQAELLRQQWTRALARWRVNPSHPLILSGCTIKEMHP